MNRYVVLVEHRARVGKVAPLARLRLTFDASTAVDAIHYATRASSVAGLGDLLVSLTVGLAGSPGYKL